MNISPIIKKKERNTVIPIVLSVLQIISTELCCNYYHSIIFF